MPSFCMTPTLLPSSHSARTVLSAQMFATSATRLPGLRITFSPRTPCGELSEQATKTRASLFSSRPTRPLREVASAPNSALRILHLNGPEKRLCHPTRLRSHGASCSSAPFSVLHSPLFRLLPRTVVAPRFKFQISNSIVGYRLIGSLTIGYAAPIDTALNPQLPNHQLLARSLFRTPHSALPLAAPNG